MTYQISLEISKMKIDVFGTMETKYFALLVLPDRTLKIELTEEEYNKLITD